MLPEHVNGLRQRRIDQKKVPKPVLDPQALEEINEKICEAMEYNSLLAFTYWKSGEFQTIVGRVHFVDKVMKQIRIKDKFDEVYYLPFDDIIDVRNIE